MAKQTSGIRTASERLKHGQACVNTHGSVANSKIPCLSYVPFEQQKNKRLLTTVSRSRS